MIDIPIGLPQHGYRECDIEAKRIVGSRVFLGARWNVWRFHSYQEANSYYWSIQDKGISRQLWSIRGKLQEVNETMTPKRQSRLKETHPELVFWRVAGNIILQSKKSDAGRAQRITLLKQNGFDQVELWLEQRRGTGIGRDDLIDACACAVSSSR
jgi:predicted RNase H-like nuclease